MEYDAKTLMDVNEVAAYLHLSPSTVYSKRARGEFPKPFLV